jgi:hypothetical protein
MVVFLSLKTQRIFSVKAAKVPNLLLPYTETGYINQKEYIVNPASPIDVDMTRR